VPLGASCDDQKWLNARAGDGKNSGRKGRRKVAGFAALAKSSLLTYSICGSKRGVRSARRRCDRRAICRGHRGGIPQQTRMPISSERNYGTYERKFNLKCIPRKTRLLELGPYRSTNGSGVEKGNGDVFHFSALRHLRKEEVNGRFTVLGKRSAKGCRRS